MEMTVLNALHTALDAIPTAIFLYQPDRVLYANRAAAALMGWSQAEIVGLRFQDVLDGSAAAGSRPTVLKTRAGQIPVTLTSEEIEYEGTHLWLMTALKRETLQAEPFDSQDIFAAIF